MKTTLRYQNGCLYVDHGAWYVKYRQRIAQEDGSSKLNRASKFLGRAEEFANIFDVERCRTSFMQIVNRDRVSANSRITITAFVEGAYLPWTKEERRASTSKGHHEIWSNHLRDRVGEFRLREFRTVDASRMLRAIAKEKDLTTTTLQHIKSVLSTIFTYARNEGAFDGANPVDGVLVPRRRMPTISTRFSKCSTSSRFSQRVWSRPRPSRGYAKVSSGDSSGPITRVPNWRSTVRFGCRWSTVRRRAPAAIPCR